MSRTISPKTPNATPPHDLELERTVLGACLIDPDAYTNASRHISPRDFYMETHGAVFAAMGALTKRGAPIDNVTVADELRVHELLDRVGGSAAIVALQAGVFTARNAEDYAKRLRHESSKRRKAALGREVVRVLDDPALDLATADPLIAELATPVSLNGAKPSPAQQLGRLYNAAQLMRATLPETKWAIPGLCPQGLSVLASRPKRGKSRLVTGWVWAVAAGGYVLGKIKVESGDTLYLALETTARSLQDYLSETFGEVEPPERMFIATEWPRLDSGGLEQLRAWLEGHPDARLIVIDTYTKVRPRSKANDDRYQVDYRDAGLLKSLADEFSVAILCLHHTRKLPSDDWIDSLSGTLGLAAAADAILGLFGSRGEAQAPLKITGRDIADTELVLGFDGGIWTLVGEGRVAGMSDERRAIVDVLRASGPLTPSQVALRVDRAASTIRTMLSKMRLAGVVSKNGDFYSAVDDPQTTVSSTPSPAPIADLLDEIL